MLYILNNLARSSPITIYAAGLLVTLVTAHPLGLIYVGLSLISDLINLIIKYSLRLYDTNNKLWIRPNPPTTGCGLFPHCSITNQIPTIGMPSGHSQMISFAFSFWIIYIWNSNSKYMSKKWKIGATIIFYLLSTLIMYSRVYEGCHTKLQVFVGYILGTIFGTAGYYIIYKWWPTFVINQSKNIIYDIFIMFC